MVNKMNTRKEFNSASVAPSSRVKDYFTSYIPVLENKEGQIELVSQFRSAMIKAAIGLILGLASFFLGQASTAMGSYPLGIGFLGAIGMYTPYVYGGLIFASVFSNGNALALAVSASITMAGRMISSRLLRRSGEKLQLFNEPLVFRLISVTLGAFTGSMVRIVSGGFLYYDLFGGIFELVTAPLFCFLLSGVFDRSKRFSAYYEAGVYSAVFAIIYSIRNFNLFGFSVAIILSCIVSFYAAEKGGLLHGGMAGLICGLAYNIVYAPAFALSGIAFGVFISMGTVVATTAAAVTGIALGIWAGGFEVLRQIAPDIVTASVIYAPLAKLRMLPDLPLFNNVTALPDTASNSAAVAQRQNKDTSDGIEALSSALYSLSELFYTLSDRIRRPGISEVQKICIDTFDLQCKNCSNKSVCWSKEHAVTTSAAEIIVDALRKNNIAEPEDLPSVFRKRCEKHEAILSECNSAYSKMIEDLVCRDKTEVFATDYKLISKLLLENAKQKENEYQIDEGLSNQLREAIKYMNFYANNIAVYGKRRRSIVAGGIELGRVRTSSDDLRTICENICGTKFTQPEFHIEDDYVTMTLDAAPRIKLESASAALEKKDEKVCGDNITTFENDDDYCYLLISDGMGSGCEAALSSRIVSIFLRRMLEAGNKLGCTLELLNNFMISRNSESFSTIDLLEIDRLQSVACFVKSGAAPSYIMRGGNLFKVSANTMPIGITRELNAEQIRFELKENDIIIMVSDGIAQTLEESAWLADLVCGIHEENMADDLDAMANIILTQAEKKSGRKDDMTVGLVKVVYV